MTEIHLSQDFSKEFSIIQRRAERGEGEAKYLLKIIEKGLAKLIDDYQAGQKIQRRFWPRYYEAKHGINNLWRLRLDDFWRLIYTLAGDRVSIVAVVLEVLNHKDYDRRFGYK